MQVFSVADLSFPSKIIDPFSIVFQGAEADEFVNIPFKKCVVLATQELFPLGNRKQQVEFNGWQVNQSFIQHFMASQ